MTLLTLRPVRSGQLGEGDLRLLPRGTKLQLCHRSGVNDCDILVELLECGPDYFHVLEWRTGLGGEEWEEHGSYRYTDFCLRAYRNGVWNPHNWVKLHSLPVVRHRNISWQKYGF